MGDRARRLLGEFGLAAALLTRLPVGWILLGDAAPGRAVWAYPVVGVVVGGVGAGVLSGGRAIGLPPALAAAWALAAMVLVTGALHEDGLADTADAMGGATPERRLQIMRDSRIGSFGAIALLLSLAVRGGAMASAPASAVVVAAALGRAAMVGVLFLLPPARPDGLAAGLGVIPAAPVAGAVAAAAAAALLLLPAGAALAAIAAATLAALAIAWLAWRRLGGHTGDVCGAAEQGAECLVFTAMAACLAR